MSTNTPQTINDCKNFQDVIAYIDAEYKSMPRPFKNGAISNTAGENQGSAKVLSYGYLHNLSEEETLKLFREHYDAVLADPAGDNHQNIRNFIKTGWAGVEFPEGFALNSITINKNIANMPANYLFRDIGQRIGKFLEANPDKKDELIRMGIGDVKLPLPKVAVDAGIKAFQRMGDEALGYDFAEPQKELLDAIVGYYKGQGVTIQPSEIFINDGAKPDTANLARIFGDNYTIAFQDPSYPVYVNRHAMAGHLGPYDFDAGKWSRAIYLPMTAENNFVPELPGELANLIYLCSPNNPTGAVMTYDQLKKWVDYANENKSVIIYDGAYEVFITNEPNAKPGDRIPHSIFEIPGAEKCAIEIRSFSKDAGFTGLRCGYMVIPNALERGGKKLRDLWNSSQGTHTNGVSYPVQCAAAAIYSPEGQKQIQDILAVYKTNTATLKDGLIDAGFEVFGAKHAPYLWTRAQNGMGSWEAFDYFLNTPGLHIACTPGEGFGKSGKGFIRFTGFCANVDVPKEAARRIKQASR